MHRPRLPSVRSLDDTVREAFLREYLLDLDVERAAARAGVEHGVAERLARSTSFQRQLDSVRRYRSGGVRIYAENVLRRWWQLATADARELVELRRVACRHCHGMDHRYQFTPEEYRLLAGAHRAEQMKLPEHRRREFDDQGGVGYDGTADPHPGCPECFGEGIPSVYLHDTRTLSPSAALLYQGVEVRTDGTCRVLMRDQQKAMDSVAAHLGMRVERHAHLHKIVDWATLSDEQLDDALATFGAMAEGEAQATIEGEDDAV